MFLWINSVFQSGTKQNVVTCMWNKVLHNLKGTPPPPPTPHNPDPTSPLSSVLLFIHSTHFDKLLEKLAVEIQKVEFSIQLAEQRDDYNSCPDILGVYFVYLLERVWR